MSTPDLKVLATIGEGHHAATLLTVFGDMLDTLAEETLKASDLAIENGNLTPETSYALLHEVGAYRRIKYRLRQKVTRANTTRAAQDAAQTEAAGDRTPPAVN